MSAVKGLCGAPFPKGKEPLFMRTGGYTLIELAVVVFLLGLMLALTVPRIPLTDDLKKATRRMIGTVKDLRDKAILYHKGHRLHFDLESNQFWVEWDGITDEERATSREAARGFPGRVRILDVSRPEGKQTSGDDTVIRFSRKGYVEQAVIHLGLDDRASSIVLSPFLGIVEVRDSYVDLENT